jgi:ADP-ribose pyrophosphatase YjhB (NUDIX family)
MEKIAEWVQRIFMWMSSDANRLRMRGARIEVIVFLMSRNPEPRILLGRSPYHGIWMPPQEGVNLKEGFDDALRRCLEVECGLELPVDSREFERTYHVRSIRFAGVVELPAERWGERPVARDAVGTPLERVSLKRKAYWMASVLIGDPDGINPVPDGKELLELRWFNLDDAHKIIQETNHAEKAALLRNCLTACADDLFGATKGLQRDMP